MSGLDHPARALAQGGAGMRFSLVTNLRFRVIPS